MSRYRIFETREYLSKLGKPGSVDTDFFQSKTVGYIYPQIREEPHFGPSIKKLVGYDPPTWRYRLGKYRLFHIIDEKNHVVSIVAVEFRKDAC